jgi:hypothetical protein
MARSSPTIFRRTSVCCNVRRPQPKTLGTALPFGTAALWLGSIPLRHYSNDGLSTVDRIASGTARYVRRGIPHGAVSHTAWYPARRCIPHGMVSRTARYSTRHGMPHGAASQHATHRPFQRLEDLGFDPEHRVTQRLAPAQWPTR